MDDKRGNFFDLSIIEKEIWFNDFEIYFEDDGFRNKGNKVMFASKSEYFKKNLKNYNCVVIKNKGGLIKHKNEVMKVVKEFFMFGHVGDLKEHILESLLRFSVLIEQKDLIKLCVSHIIKSLCESNFVNYRRLAVNFNLKSLINATKMFASRNFDEIRDKYFFAMDDEFLEDILRSDTLNTDSEEKLFLLLKNWILYNKNKRSIHFKKLFNLLYLDNFSTQFMNKHVCPFYVEMESSRLPNHQTLETLKRKNIKTIRNMENVNMILYDDFLELSYIELNRFIQNSNLCDMRAEIFFYGLERWVKHDSYSREIFFADLMEYVEWEKIHDKFILNNIIKYPFLCSCRAIRDKLQKMIIEETMLIIGDENADRAESIQVYKSEAKTWKILRKINKNINSFASVILNDKLLIIGGKTDHLFLNDVWSYDLINSKAVALPPINVTRSCFTATVIEDSVYICGGCNNHYTTNTLEVWNSRISTWEVLSSMKVKRRLHSAVAYNGKLYVFGGIYENNVSSDVEIYDPKTNMWSFGSPMIKAVHSCAKLENEDDLVSLSIIKAAVLNNSIFIMGGRTNNEESIKSVFTYDPQINIWKHSVELPFEMSGLSAITMDNKIIISGGNDSTKVYEFDHQAQVWRRHSTLAVNRHNHTMLMIPYSLWELQMFNTPITFN